MLLLTQLRRKPREVHGFPVVRGSLPFVGHLHRMAFDLLNLSRKAEAEFGPYCWMDFGISRLLFCLAPDSLSMLKNKAIGSGHLLSIMPEFLEDTVIAQDGPVHARMRSVMNRPFQPRGLSAGEVGAITAKLIEATVRSWLARSDVKILDETRQLAINAIFRIIGIAEDELRLWRHHFVKFVRLALFKPAMGRFYRTAGALRSRDWLDEQLLGLIRKARRDGEASGLLGAWLQARDENGELMSEGEVLRNVRLLGFAGHETTAAAMAWMTIKLAEEPDVWDALCTEANAAGDIPQTAQDLRKFTFTEAVVREALRFYPPTPLITRDARDDFDLAGRTVPRGTLLGLPLAHLSRHPALHERPDEFLPGRWLDSRKSVTSLETLQFGGGPHFCLGYHLAWMELVQYAVAIAKIMGRRGLRPRLVGRRPIPLYLPLQHPPLGTRVVFSSSHKTR